MIRLAEVNLPQASLDNAAEALAKGELSHRTHWVQDFERAFADWLGVPHAVACSSGTAALHLALLALDLKPGSVMVPDLAYPAVANAVVHAGLQPDFRDVDVKTWTLPPEESLAEDTRAVITVDNLGGGAIANGGWRAPIIRDACESLGLRGCGADITVYSFYANKLLTTGEGGMLVTNNPAWAARARLFRGQGDPTSSYHPSVVGYNYRMTAVQAAIGLGQIPELAWRCKRQQDIRDFYKKHISLPYQQDTDAGHSGWVFGVLVPDVAWFRAALSSEEIEMRHMFPRLSTLGLYDTTHHSQANNASEIAQHGVMLPSHYGMYDRDVHRVCEAVKRAVR